MPPFPYFQLEYNRISTARQPTMDCNNSFLSPILNIDEWEQSTQLKDKLPLQETSQPMLLSSPVSSLPPSPSQLPLLCRQASVMPLPPEAIYTSCDELYTAIQAHAKQYNYAFVRRKSRKINQYPRRKVVYSCDRCKPPPTEFQSATTGQARKRRTSSRRTGCLFSINAIQINETLWELRHRPDQKFAIHNHPPSYSWTSHPSHRRLDNHTKQKIHQFQNAGKELP
jgi:hypothetical protein